MPSNLGDILSRQYDIPLESQGSQQAPTELGIQSPVDGGMPEFENDIQAVSGMTKDYYTKIANLKTFAHKMASMGIDVTKPDVMDARSIQANDIWNKAMADIQNQGVLMKEGRKIVDYSRAAGNDVNLNADSTQELMTDANIVDTRNTDRGVITDKDAVISSSRKVVGEKNAEIDKSREIVTQELNAAIDDYTKTGNPEAKSRIEELRSELDRIRNASHDNSQEVHDANMLEIAKLKDGADKSTNRLIDIQSFAAGNKGVLEGKNSSQYQAPVTEVEIVGDTAYITFQKLSDGKWMNIVDEVDLTNDESVNSYFNQHFKEQVDEATLAGLNPKIKVNRAPKPRDIRENNVSAISGALDLLANPSEEATGKGQYANRTYNDKAIAARLEKQLIDQAKNEKLVLPSYKKLSKIYTETTKDGKPISDGDEIRFNEGTTIQGISLQPLNDSRKFRNFIISLEDKNGNDTYITLDPSNPRDREDLRLILERNGNRLDWKELQYDTEVVDKPVEEGEIPTNPMANTVQTEEKDYRYGTTGGTGKGYKIDILHNIKQ